MSLVIFHLAHIPLSIPVSDLASQESIILEKTLTNHSILELALSLPVFLEISIYRPTVIVPVVVLYLHWTHRGIPVPNAADPAVLGQKITSSPFLAASK